jgi:CheY-like chemotaxis protein/predicted transcriptional regulator
MTVEEILARKGFVIHTVAADVSLEDVSRQLRDKDIGVLVCTDQSGGVVGIVSERDLARALGRHGSLTAALSVAEIMTRDVVACGLNDSAEYLLCLMTETRCRHIPVVHEGVLTGLISIGDVVKARMTPPSLPVEVSVGPRVVAVDDDITTRSLIGGVLTKQGFDVVTCAGGQEMWAALEQRKPSVILLDIEMPGDCGLTLTEQLRTRYGFGISIVMLSGRDDQLAKSMAYDVGADDYLTKPCDWFRLVDVITRHAAAHP